MRSSLFVGLLTLALARAYVTIVRKYPDKNDERDYAKHCQELAVGVNLCNEIDIDGKKLEIIVNNHFIPSNCRMKIGKGDYTRLHYSLTIGAPVRV